MDVQLLSRPGPTPYLIEEAAGLRGFRKHIPVYTAHMGNRTETRTFAFQVMSPVLTVVATPNTNPELKGLSLSPYGDMY